MIFVIWLEFEKNFQFFIPIHPYIDFEQLITFNYEKYFFSKLIAGYLIVTRILIPLFLNQIGIQETKKSKEEKVAILNQ